MIHKFFAVTETSVYEVTDEKDEKGCPIVKKIALREESAIAVGERITGGYYIGVSRIGIVLYSFPLKERRGPEFVNVWFWGGKTSPIIALFLDKDKAAICLNSGDLQNCDPRWQEETQEVFETIGNNHPVFIPSSY